ncbi:MAG: histidinol-phosphate transaminase [Alphaproteobacteria bacterium]
MSSGFDVKDTILQISPYVPGESKLDTDNPIRQLAANEAPLGASPKAIEAAQDSVAQLNRYPEGGAVALRTKLGERFGFPAEQLICGAGSDEIIALICQAFAGEGSEVLYSQHGFLMYKISALAAGATPVAAPETNLRMDVDSMIDALTERTKVVFVANPNNPTGSYSTKAELERLHAALPKDTLLVIDAAYSEYVDADDYSDGSDLVATHSNVVMTRTFSKLFGLAALRIGWAYASAEVIDILNRVRGPFNVSVPAQAAATAALDDWDWAMDAKALNNRLLPVVTQRLRGMGLTVYDSVGNFVLIDFQDADRAKAADAFLRSEGVIGRGVAGYGLPTCLRMTIGTEEDMDFLTDALTRFTESTDA